VSRCASRGVTATKRALLTLHDERARALPVPAAALASVAAGVAVHPAVALDSSSAGRQRRQRGHHLWPAAARVLQQQALLLQHEPPQPRSLCGRQLLRGYLQLRVKGRRLRRRRLRVRVVVVAVLLVLLLLVWRCGMKAGVPPIAWLLRLLHTAVSAPKLCW
jgi:hypothetical protein